MQMFFFRMGCIWDILSINTYTIYRYSNFDS